MSDKPRTWTLAFDGHYTNAALDGDYNQPNDVSSDPVWVVELTPEVEAALREKGLK